LDPHPIPLPTFPDFSIFVFIIVILLPLTCYAVHAFLPHDDAHPLDRFAWNDGSEASAAMISAAREEWDGGGKGSKGMV
jgi:hypothetical protein